jgi:SAM-dependent methyltransferase
MGELYKSLAWCYEFITTGKGHKEEADFLIKTVKKYKKSKGNTLLDVGCGHGWHDKFLKKSFKITGIDLNKEILNFAKMKNPEVKYKILDMRKFNLNKKFDVVISFDAMMYNLNYRNLRTTIENLSKHLKDGGLLIFHLDRLKDNFKQYGIVSNPENHRFSKKNIFITYFQIDYDKNPKDTVFESCIIFFISKKGRCPEIRINTEKMGLFELSKIKKILAELGFKTYIYSGDFSGKKYSNKSPFPVFACMKK